MAGSPRSYQRELIQVPLRRRPTGRSRLRGPTSLGPATSHELVRCAAFHAAKYLTDQPPAAGCASKWLRRLQVTLPVIRLYHLPTGALAC